MLVFTKSLEYTSKCTNIKCTVRVDVCVTTHHERPMRFSPRSLLPCLSANLPPRKRTAARNKDHDDVAVRQDTDRDLAGRVAAVVNDNHYNRTNCSVLIFFIIIIIIIIMSSSSNQDDSEQTSIRLDEMSLDQLQQLRQQEESRRQGLTNRFAQLRAAAARIHASTRAVQEMHGAAADKQVLVPLTESVFVPGKLVEPHKMLVDIGTGFFVEKNAKETQAFLDRKMRLVDANSQNVTVALQTTNANVEAITTAMQGKFMEIRAKQMGARHRAAVEGGTS